MLYLLYMLCMYNMMLVNL